MGAPVITLPAVETGSGRLFGILIGAAAVVGWLWLRKQGGVSVVIERLAPEEAAAVASAATAGQGQADKAWVTQPGNDVVASGQGGTEQLVPPTGVYFDILIEGAPILRRLPGKLCSNC